MFNCVVCFFRDGCIVMEIYRRVSAECNTLDGIHKFISNVNLPLAAKFELCKGVLLPILIWGSEC